MPAPLTYATAHAYLLDLGERFFAIGRSELTYTGEASESAKYPLLLVEGDSQGNEVLDGARPTGLDTFTIAVQVLVQQPSPKPADLAAMLVQANAWVDQLTQQLREERPQQLMAVGKLALPGVAGTALATGWRVELTLKVPKEIDRSTNKALFAPEVI